MPDKDQQNSWNRFIDAAKNAGATKDRAAADKPPSSFVSSVIAMRENLWQFAKTVLWRRWSLVAALIAIVLYLTFYVIMKTNPPEPDPVPAPSPTPTPPLPPDP